MLMYKKEEGPATIADPSRHADREVTQYFTGKFLYRAVS